MTVKKLGRVLHVLVLSVACGGPLRYQTQSTGNAPGADAQIEADVNPEQRLTQLTVEIKNLPPPERVEPSGQHYMAWYRTNANVAWTRIGALEYEADAREAKLVSSVPELQFDLEITVEPSTNVASPSPHVVLAQVVGG